MSSMINIDLKPIRKAMRGLDISPRIEPNQTIDLDRVLFPESHRSVLDTRRQLVIGNRGVGKSFWTHALTNPEIRKQLAQTYSYSNLARTIAVIGFNGSTKQSEATPSISEVQNAFKQGFDAEVIWQAAILRAIRSKDSHSDQGLEQILKSLKQNPELYSTELSRIDNTYIASDEFALIVFDALDRLAQDWTVIRALTKGLLITVLGLQSFSRIRAKVFMRVDQFSDPELFGFPDSSKIRNDHTDLAWRSHELYALLIFELLRDSESAAALASLAKRLDAESALPIGGSSRADLSRQEALINAIAGEYMGKGAKRGRVYSWVPLHLGDAANHCSPRTFLTAWKSAAEHHPSPEQLAVDHLGLNEGVRRASGARLAELKEDYGWIDLALKPLRGQFVPIERSELFEHWTKEDAMKIILEQAESQKWLAPIGVTVQARPDILLQAMTSIAVMEERANGKVNVPDIFRVEAGILRRGGVAVPKKKF